MTNTIKKWLARIEGQRKPGSKSAKSWWRWPLLVLLVMLGMFVASYVLNRNGRELAKLRHEKNKREIEEGNARAELLLNIEENRSRVALAEVKKARVALLDIERQLTEEEAKHEQDKAAIDRMRWSDLPRANQ